MDNETIKVIWIGTGLAAGVGSVIALIAAPNDIPRWSVFALSLFGSASFSLSWYVFGWATSSPVKFVLLHGCTWLLMALLGAAVWPKDKAVAENNAQQEPLTLKHLFQNDFKVFANEYESSLTIGSKTQRFPETTLKFSSRLWMDLREGTEILAFYIPIQDSDPNQDSKKSVLLCRSLPSNFSAIVKHLEGMQISASNERGSMLKSTDLTLSRRIYIYHEAFMSPQDTGDLVREYETLQWLPEFRGSEYRSKQELLRATGLRKD